MIMPFTFSRLPHIFFGVGKISEVPSLLKKYGNNILLVTGNSSFNSGIYSARLSDELERDNVKLNRFSITGEPGPAVIDEAVSLYLYENIDAIVAIGGGSVIDAGKAISAMLTVKGSVKEYLEGVGSLEHPGTKIPFIAVPTTSGTGSEATKNAVISQTGLNGFKRSLRHDNFIPDIAVIDPELTLSCSPEITAASGMDCFTQLLEAYLSTKSSEFTDALALEGLRAIKHSLKRSYIDGGDLEARTGMSFAALTSGICLANAGLGVVHGFAATAGGMYQVPHGVLCGTLMAVANEINLRQLRRTATNTVAEKKYALLGKMFLDESGKTKEYYADAFISYLHVLTIELRLPGLSNLGLEKGKLRAVCEKTDVKNNPVRLNHDELLEILERRFQ